MIESAGRPRFLLAFLTLSRDMGEVFPFGLYNLVRNADGLVFILIEDYPKTTEVRSLKCGLTLKFLLLCTPHALSIYLVISLGSIETDD